MSRLFGTDGIRGVANEELTPELAMRVGRAAAEVLASRGAPFVVGRDTRVSGSMLEAAIAAGVTSVGCDIVSVGIVPTPGVACIARRTGAAAGVVISASHNPVEDNGIKFFGSDGYKLPDDVENAIEARLEAGDGARPIGVRIGKARSAYNLARHYYEELYESRADLHGLHVVIDGAFGAAYAIAPYAMRKLGARVSEINCEDDGSRINVGCGATDLRPLQQAVQAAIAAGDLHVVGVAFDGDADRALFVDETGAVVNGDGVLYAFACEMQARGELAADTVVGTVMSNIGLERALGKHGIGLVRAAVGDRYVLERMREGGYTLGGEPSGHIIDLRVNTTGDGPMTAVTLLGLVSSRRMRLHDLVQEVVAAPQILINVRTNGGDVLAIPSVRAAIADAEEALRGSGRLLVRRSGTEPLIRVMAEGDDRATVERLATALAGQIEREAGREGPGAGRRKRGTI